MQPLISIQRFKHTWTEAPKGLMLWVLACLMALILYEPPVSSLGAHLDEVERTIQYGEHRYTFRSGQATKTGSVIW